MPVEPRFPIPKGKANVMSHLVHWLRILVLPLLYAAALLVAGQPAKAQAQGEAGTWEGTASQPGAGSFSVIMQLDGAGGGTTAYPSLSCTGLLSGGPGAYTSSIVNNRAVPGGSGGCIDGIVSVSVSGDQMNWSWSGSWEGESYTASAVLTRSGSGGGGDQECDVCGRALSSDVAAGLSSSAMLSTYVQQSVGKYQNCTRRAGDGCDASCWRANLATLLPNCNQFADNGFRDCVQQTVDGANGTCQ